MVRLLEVKGVCPKVADCSQCSTKLAYPYLRELWSTSIYFTSETLQHLASVLPERSRMKFVHVLLLLLILPSELRSQEDDDFSRFSVECFFNIPLDRLGLANAVINFLKQGNSWVITLCIPTLNPKPCCFGI